MLFNTSSPRLNFPLTSKVSTQENSTRLAKGGIDTDEQENANMKKLFNNAIFQKSARHLLL